MGLFDNLFVPESVMNDNFPVTEAPTVGEIKDTALTSVPVAEAPMPAVAVPAAPLPNTAEQSLPEIADKFVPKHEEKLQGINALLQTTAETPAVVPAPPAEVITMPSQGATTAEALVIDIPAPVAAEKPDYVKNYENLFTQDNFANTPTSTTSTPDVVVTPPVALPAQPVAATADLPPTPAIDMNQINSVPPTDLSERIDNSLSALPSEEVKKDEPNNTETEAKKSMEADINALQNQMKEVISKSDIMERKMEALRQAADTMVKALSAATGTDTRANLTLVGQDTNPDTDSASPKIVNLSDYRDGLTSPSLVQEDPVAA